MCTVVTPFDELFSEISLNCFHMMKRFAFQIKCFALSLRRLINAADNKRFVVNAMKMLLLFALAQRQNA